MRRAKFQPSKPNPEPNSEPSNPEPNQKMQPIKSFPRSKPNHNSKPKSKLLPVLLITITLSITFYFLILPFVRAHHVRNSFRVIIDAGSTGTRVHVFEYRENERYDFGEKGHCSMRVSPGLSSYDGDPDRAGGSLRELLEFAKGKVPREAWEGTEVRLMGTAGLRLVDDVARDKILESCRDVLRDAGFVFRDEWASVITGSDEGLYAWVVANYALGTLGGNPQETAGIIELGGASAQVTFVSSESLPHELSRTLTYGNQTYNLYSNSLLHFGQNVAFESLKELLLSTGSKLSTGSSDKGLIIDPCTPKGFAQSADLLNLTPDSLALSYSSTFRATGNFSECRAAALTLLQKGKEDCLYHHCSLGATYMPKLKGRFLATENFFHTSQFLGLTPKSLLSDVMMAGQQFCEDDWSNIKKKHSSHEEEDLLPYCFSSAYIVALLHDSLGIALDDERIQYTNQVERIPLDWALGAFILQTTGATVGENHGWIASTFGDDFPNVSLLLVAAILLLLLVCYVSRWRKPYFKTIYDLEKGRYIVTRISR